VIEDTHNEYMMYFIKLISVIKHVISRYTGIYSCVLHGERTEMLEWVCVCVCVCVYLTFRRGEEANFGSHQCLNSLGRSPPALISVRILDEYLCVLVSC